MASQSYRVNVKLTRAETKVAFGGLLDKPIDIILPVYNGLDDLKRCLNSLLSARTKLDWHAYVINDASTDTLVASYLDSFKENKRITVISNETNLGFVETVNKGFSLTKHDVLLLNSDTIVYDAWLDRLVMHALSPKVATITPLSNNATIASFLEICSEENTTAGLTGQQIDLLCYEANNGNAVRVPTGIGFCMYISREALETVGYFNSKDFGRGYGEENDFCVRATEKGFTNLIATDVYVYHAGGVSFGEEKQARVLNAVKKLNELYPFYDKKIHEFVSLDPIREFRLRTLIKLSKKDDRPAILHVCHNHGGGTLQHIRELGERFEAESINWVLRALGGHKVRLEWSTAPSTYIDIDTEEDKVFFWELLKGLRLSRVHVHHIAALPKEVLTFIKESGLNYDVTIHDYFFIAANPTLADARGRIQLNAKGIPLAQSSLSTEELKVWQAEQHAFLEQAQRVLCPSKASKAIYKHYFPKVNYKLALHVDAEDVIYPDISLRNSLNSATKVLVVGAINREKGADVIEAVAKQLQADNMGITLLGYAFRKLHKSVNVLGVYAYKDIDDLILKEDPDLIWFPALWPETYSYTLSAALRSGKPILAPSIGAFPERLANRPYTKTYDSLGSTESTLSEITQFAKEITVQNQATLWAQQTILESFYATQYLNPNNAKTIPTLAEPELFEALAYRLEPHLNAKEHVLAQLVGLKRFWIFRRILRRIPVEHKLRFVKFFTTKNLLDLQRQPAK